MKRGLFAIALLACNHTITPPPPPASLSLNPQPASYTLTQGQTQSIKVFVVSDSSSVTLGFGALPQGLSGDSIQWHGEPSVLLDLIVAPDAPNLPITDVDIVATQNGSTLATAPIHVSVAPIPDGALDPLFGQGGKVQIQTGGFVKLNWIEPRSGGGWTVAGTTWDQSTGTKLIVVQLDASGTVQSMSPGTSVPSIGSFTIDDMAKSDDGVYAAGIYYGSPSSSYAALFLDASFAPTSVEPLQNEPDVVGFNGTSLLVPELFPDLQQPLEQITSYLGVNNGVYVTAWMAATPAPAELHRYVPSGGSYALDATFDASSVVANHVYVGAMATDASGRLLVGAAGTSDAGMVRVLADGTLDTTFGNGGYASVGAQLDGERIDRIYELPSGDHLVLGQGGGSFALRFTADGAPVTTFGTNGQAFFGASTQILGAAMDASATHVCTTDNDTIYCLRVAP